MTETARFAFDCETDGFKPSKIHCLVLACLNTGAVYGFADQPGYPPIAHGVEILAGADELVGHNIVNFDLPVLKKLYNVSIDRSRVVDTLVMARVLWPDQRDADAMLDAMPPALRGRHGLKSWGYRLNILKGAFGETSDWQRWSPQMQQYCAQDVYITTALYFRIAGEVNHAA